jgi:type IX secretion system PorP/SprF family membrane protein
MKSLRILKLFFIWLALFTFSLSAQQNILLNQASYNLFTLNPAAIGLNSDIQANCHYKKNWIGLADSPELMQITLDGALHKNKSGLGLNLINERAGIFSKTYFSGAFRHKIKLSKSQDLLFGLSVGFQRQASDFSRIKADATEEFAQWPQQQSVTIPDAGFGLVYLYKKIVIGVSASQLLQQNYSYREPVYNKELQYKTVSQFVFHIQNTFVLKPETWFYVPQLIVRTPQGLPFQIDILNTFNFKNKFLLGLGYRYYYALYANLGYSITDKLRITYSYEYSQGIQKYTKGGHEIGLSFGLFPKSSKSKSTDSQLNKTALDEIFEKLDQHDQQIEVLTKKVDSLDKNLNALKSEMEDLKSKQVSEEELASAIQNYYTNNKPKSNSNASDHVSKQENKVDKAGKYKVISPTKESDYEAEEEVVANYKIVLGVYQLPNYAKKYQKFLKRELGWESKLIQLNDHPKKFIYVCVGNEYSNLKEALKGLKMAREDIKTKSVEVTKGEAWILQTLVN